MKLDDLTQYQRIGWSVSDAGLTTERGTFRFRVSAYILSTTEGNVVTEQRLLWCWQLWVPEGADPDRPLPHWGMRFTTSVSKNPFTTHDAACFAVESLRFE